MKKIILVTVLAATVLTTQVSQAATATAPKKEFTAEEIVTAIRRDMRNSSIENGVIDDLGFECSLVEEVDKLGRTYFAIKAEHGVVLKFTIFEKDKWVLAKQVIDGDDYSRTYQAMQFKTRITFGYADDSFDTVTIENGTTKLTCGVYM